MILSSKEMVSGSEKAGQAERLLRTLAARPGQSWRDGRPRRQSFALGHEGKEGVQFPDHGLDVGDANGFVRCPVGAKVMAKKVRKRPLPTAFARPRFHELALTLTALN